MKQEKLSPMDTDLAGVEKALLRAAKAARVVSRQTRTPCLIYQDGQIIDVSKRKKASLSDLHPS